MKPYLTPQFVDGIISALVRAAPHSQNADEAKALEKKACDSIPKIEKIIERYEFEKRHGRRKSEVKKSLRERLKSSKSPEDIAVRATSAERVMLRDAQASALHQSEDPSNKASLDRALARIEYDSSRKVPQMSALISLLDIFVDVTGEQPTWWHDNRPKAGEKSNVITFLYAVDSAANTVVSESGEIKSDEWVALVPWIMRKAIENHRLIQKLTQEVTSLPDR